MTKCKVIALANQKGGTAKTTTTLNLGIGLAHQGRKVLLVDADPQGDLTTALGWTDADDLPVTLATQMKKILQDVMNDGTIHSTFNEGHMRVEGETAYCVDINTGFKNGYKTRHDASASMSAAQIEDVALSLEYVKQYRGSHSNLNTNQGYLLEQCVVWQRLSEQLGWKCDNVRAAYSEISQDIQNEVYAGARAFVQANKGRYKCGGYIYTGEGQDLGQFWAELNVGNAKVKKTTANEIVTNGNAMYQLKGWQMLKEENAVLLIDGKRVESDYTFVADSEKMKVEISYTFDASELGGQNLVTFEELYDLKNPEEPVKVAAHKDIDDEGQTVLITERKISIHTTATDKNGKKEIEAGKDLTIVDAGYGTEKEIVNMTMDEMLALPGVNVADLCIISELQKSIKANKVISYLSEKTEEREETKGADYGGTT